MKVSAELTLEIDRLRQNAQAAEEHLKRVGVVGAASAAKLDQSLGGVGRNFGRNIDTGQISRFGGRLAESNQHFAKFAAGLGGSLGIIDGSDALQGMDKQLSAAG